MTKLGHELRFTSLHFLCFILCIIELFKIPSLKFFFFLGIGYLLIRDCYCFINWFFWWKKFLESWSKTPLRPLWGKLILFSITWSFWTLKKESNSHNCRQNMLVQSENVDNSGHEVPNLKPIDFLFSLLKWP